MADPGLTAGFLLLSLSVHGDVLGYGFGLRSRVECFKGNYMWDWASNFFSPNLIRS